MTLTTRKKSRSIRWKLAKMLLTEEERSLLWGIHKAVSKGYRYADKTDQLAQGQEVFIRATVAFPGVIPDLITCKNENGYYYTVPRSDIALKQFGHWEDGRCSECGTKDKKEPRFCSKCGSENEVKKDE